MDRYDPHEIERRWQAVWAEERTWEVPNPGEPGFDDSKPKSYVLEMLPYPSGEPHVGHLKNYSIGDAIAHFRRRHGFQVIHPMGYDAFGLPAENNAIKTGEHPARRRRGVDRRLPRAVPRLGRLDRLVARDLHPRARATTAGRSGSSCGCSSAASPTAPRRPVQWCPVDQTVLANEQVIDGHCERCGSLVEPRNLEQWFFKITDYADRLLDRLRPARVLARARGHDAAQLDRPLRGRRGHLPLRGARDRLPRLHHPPRHPLRRHLLRRRARAPRRRAPRRRHRARGRPSATTSTRRSASRPRSAPPRSARRPASRSAARSPTRSTASRSRCSSPTTC